MATKFEIQPTKTYATEANAVKAVAKVYGGETDGLRYFVMKNAEGRFFPVFVGDTAVNESVFFHFNVIR